MKKQNVVKKLSGIVIIIVLMILLVISFKIFRLNYFNGFEKATNEILKTKFTRDSNEKYSDMSSYKIENLDYNDAAIYKEIDVEPNTPYKITCMVKTQDIECDNQETNGGATIGILDTTEYLKPIVGTNDWQQVEFMFNSNNKDKVKVSFRIGGNDNKCKGTVWFSDFKVEKGVKNTDTEWNIGCFIIKELNVNIDGSQYNFKTTVEDIDNIRLNMERYKETCNELSDNKMTVKYEIIEVDKPITTISYSEEHGYHLSHEDVQEAIYEIAKQKEFDHIFAVCRMEDENGNSAIPIKGNWIGLGGMDIYGIGYSLVRINKTGNTYTYRYGITNQMPEEVYVHEFLHGLERNMKERGYEVPALHDYEKYGYKEELLVGLNKWYRDYMRKSIATGKEQYIGLDEYAYTTQPPNSSNFRYTVDIEFNKEPDNIFEEISTIINVILNK